MNSCVRYGIYYSKNGVRIMKIESIYIDGYKNVIDTRIEMNSINAILSVNNYGKSNFLEAIDFATDFLQANAKQRRIMMSYVKGIPLNPSIDTKPFTFEIVVVDESLGEYKEVKYGFSFEWIKDDGTGCRIINEWLDARPNESVRYTSFLKRSEGKYRKSKDTASYRRINLNESQLAIDILEAIDDIGINPVVKLINSISFRVCSSLDLSERFSSEPIEFIGDNNQDTISFDDDDVPRALYRLMQNSPEKYDLFCDAIYSLFPHFLSISIKAYEPKVDNIGVLSVNNNNGSIVTTPVSEPPVPFKIKDEMYRLFITSKDFNQPINMVMMSTGTKRIFWLLANVFIASCNHMSIIGIEELETSIHPRLLKQLLEILNEEAYNTPIIISSHSPYLIKYLKPNRIYLGKPNDEGIATFRRVQSKKVSQLSNDAYGNGVSVGEYLFELMSGDSDSYKVLSNYLEES